MKLLNIVDEFTRESLVMLTERNIDADRIVRSLERLCGERGAPELLRCDNGPEMTAHALRDWCVLSGTGTVFIEPGSPWQNPFVESFHSRVRDELLDIEEFSCLAEDQVVIGDWREDYNQQAILRARDARTSRIRRPVDNGQRAGTGSMTGRGISGDAPRPSPLSRSLRSRLRDDGREQHQRGHPSARSATFPPAISTILSLVVDRQTGSGQLR